MLATGAEVFVQIGEGSEGHMHTARVVAWSENLVTAAFAGYDVPVSAGQTAWLCYDWDGQFLRRPCRVDAVMDGEDRRTVGLQLGSDATAADRRESTRVSTAIVGLTIEVNGEPGCPLLDVSANGFAAVASVKIDIGHTADVSLQHAGRRFHGQVRVRSAREITPGQYRYGMYCLVHRTAGGDLPEGLRRVRDAVMRRRTRRTSA